MSTVTAWRTRPPRLRLPHAAPVERAALDAALRTATDAGDPVPCLDPGRRHLWLSEIDTEILEAQLRCRSCPVLTQCQTYRTAVRPTAGVYAGQYPRESNR